MKIENARFNMIEQQIRPWDVLDPRVLSVMNEIPRENYVPKKYKSNAFADIEIPLGHGQYMMSPKLEGRMLQNLQIKAEDRILEIGTGSGYLTACLAKLGASVVTVEYIEELGRAAEAQLQAAGFDNINFRIGNGANGWDKDGPFDIIAVTGSVPRLNSGFQSLLRKDGKLFVIVGEEPIMQAHLLTRMDENNTEDKSLFETSVACLETLSIEEKFEF